MKRLAPVLVVTLCSTAALAASNPARNRCNDAIRELRSNPGTLYLKDEVDPLNLENARRHRAQVGEGIARANKQLERIPAGEFDKEDPDLKECVDEFAKWNEYVKVVDEKLSAAEATAQWLVPFLSEVKPYERSFTILARVAVNPTESVLDNLKLPEAKKVLEDMAAVEKSCKAHVPNPNVPHGGGAPIPGGFGKQPGNWCKIAVNRTLLMTRAVGNMHFQAEGYGPALYTMNQLLPKMDSNNGYMDAWLAQIVMDDKEYKALIKKDIVAWYKGLGLELPAAPLAGFDAKLAELRAKVDALAPTLELPKGPRASDIEAKAKKGLSGIYPKAKFVTAAMDAGEWTISKNGAGIPLDRYRSGQIVFSLPGAKWCLQRTFSYVEPYTGGGKFQGSATAKILGATRFLACK